MIGYFVPRDKIAEFKTHVPDGVHAADTCQAAPNILQLEENRQPHVLDWTSVWQTDALGPSQSTKDPGAVRQLKFGQREIEADS